MKMLPAFVCTGRSESEEGSK